MHSEIVTITPDLARFWLGRNQGNRSISERTVAQYAKDMINGDWHTTNQGIGFFKDGRLADGQHRLHAIIRSNKPVTMLVVYDLDEGSVDGIDINRIRSLADIMTMKNGKTSSNEIAVLRLAYNVGQKVSPAQMQIMWIESIERLRKITSMFNGANQLLRKSPLIAALLMANNAGLSLDKISDFVQVLKTGVFHNDGEQSVFLLRDKILQGEFKANGGAVRNQQLKQVLHIIQKFAQNKRVKKLSMIENYAYPPLKIVE